MSAPTEDNPTGAPGSRQTFFEKAFWYLLDKHYDIVLPHAAIRCIVCDFSGRRGDFEVLTDEDIFGGGKLERYRCPRCEAVFGPLKYLELPQHLVDEDYRLLYERYSEADLSEIEKEVFLSMEPRRDGTYLNWGSGGAWNSTIAELRSEGWNVWGYEPSAQARSEYVISSRKDLAPSYDGIFSNNVIEHFRDPVAEFGKLRGLLKDGGIMVHGSPCYVYSYSYTRFHTFFPLGRSVEHLALRTGFDLSPDVRIISQYIMRKFLRSGAG